MSEGIAVLVFRILAGLATIGLVSSPSVQMRRIYKQKHVGVASVAPLAALLGSSHIWMLYGYLTENYFPLLSCFLYGECCAIVFLGVYWYYCTDKCYVTRVLAAVLTILSLVTIYAIVSTLGYTRQTTSSVKTIMGLIADCGGLCLYGAPMEKLFQVLKHKSAVFINVHMVIAGLTSNILWLTYGFLITNWFIISLNAFFVVVNVFTLCLYHIYDPRTHPLQDGCDSHTSTDNEGNTFVCIEIAPQPSKTSIVGSDYGYLSSPVAAAY
ncbi:hypothetical protein KRP22_006453 [Phytophthora ramorum]|uniref:MtN3-like protein n=1 Tax=Phytophthora ramorum TaxID=164328 RepID=H3GDQ4_PHYRM|nr:Bidirectional sugar transporter NEC1 [Phytophthora ramorum]KAH7507314.1 Bidirectional sugar transporter NEC1 [Phytophthora ramorum]